MKLPLVNRRRKADFPVVRLSVEDLAYVLDMIEDVYAEATGERLSSSAFYELYIAGEVDSPFALGWATYYDAYRRQSHRRSAAAQRALEALPPVAPLVTA